MKKRKLFITTSLTLFSAWATSKMLIKPRSRPKKSALQFDAPIVFANRAGMGEAPADTLIAFQQAADAGVHGFSISVRLTKDEEIVVIHDDYVNGFTNLSGKVADYTLAQLQGADAAYYYVDEKNTYSYRGQGLTILTLEEVFRKFPHSRFIIHMQDAIDTYAGNKLPEKLYELIEKLQVHHKVIVTSKSDEQIDRFQFLSKDQLAIGGHHNELRKGYSHYISQLGHLYRPTFDVLFCTSNQVAAIFHSPRFLQFLSTLNIPVFSKFVDVTDDVEHLMKCGISGFITNHPAALMTKLNDYMMD